MVKAYKFSGTHQDLEEELLRLQKKHPKWEVITAVSAGTHAWIVTLETDDADTGG
jgi:hypothetical protein